jgi:hypothetical protein
MGLLNIILSLCCLTEDSDDSTDLYSPQPSSSVPSNMTTRPPAMSTSTTLNEFGTPGDIYTPNQIMQRLYGNGGTGGVTKNQMSIRQPQHPCFIPPRLKITPPTFREGPMASRRGAWEVYQDEGFLQVPPRPKRRGASLGSRGSSYAGMGRRHVRSVEF